MYKICAVLVDNNLNEVLMIACPVSDPRATNRPLAYWRRVIVLLVSFVQDKGFLFKYGVGVNTSGFHSQKVSINPPTPVAKK